MSKVAEQGSARLLDRFYRYLFPLPVLMLFYQWASRGTCLRPQDKIIVLIG